MPYTPMMEQYFQIKNAHQDCIVFYRLGDFYEMFFDDAILASKELEIALTGRECGMEERAPMCGVPYHSVNVYINKLISKGYKVAICEQITDPKESKGLVERDIIRIITPGTVIEEEMLDEKCNNYLAAVYANGHTFALALCDVSTGQFTTSVYGGQNSFSALVGTLLKFSPHELVCVEGSFIQQNLHLKISESYRQPPAAHEAKAMLEKQFGKDALGALSKEEMRCAGMLLAYVFETQKAGMEHINKIKRLDAGKYMKIGQNARTHLELFSTVRTGKKQDSLYGLLDKTHTSMGGRLLRNWLSFPLQDQKAINTRLDGVELLKNAPIITAKLQELLANVYDIERIISKLTYGTLHARDCIALKKSLSVLPKVKDILGELNCSFFQNILAEFDEMTDIFALLDEAITEEPPLSIKEGEIIKPAFHAQLQKLDELCQNSKNYLLALEQKEREETGIKNLKLGYNKVFGYFLEVTKSYYDLVPYRYTRKQTLANCERFVTPELKELENEIFSASDKKMKLEYAIFMEIRQNLITQITRFQKVSSQLARIDVITAFAQIAANYGYTRPVMNEKGIIRITKGRHPIVERSVGSGFVPNDALLDNGDHNFSIITGPNMAGKSTYMRQVALIVIMAHMGCFVPAEQAEIAFVDQVFTRIGASDQLSEGKSTFMVEMTELAEIVKSATADSLIILDEIGRGTSTIDGLSIAMATVMHITKRIHAKTLFATHYHQLSILEEKMEGVKNLQIAVKEEGDQVVFLHTIQPGGADKSFGIYVAQLAGLPDELTKTAKKILEDMAADTLSLERVDTSYVPEEKEDTQVKERFAALQSELRQIDVNRLTPVEALTLLAQLKEEWEG